MCSFSPCIEQVMRTCEELSSHNFTELTTMECLVRNFDIRTINLPYADLGPSELADCKGVSKPNKHKCFDSGAVNDESKMNVDSKMGPDSETPNAKTIDNAVDNDMAIDAENSSDIGDNIKPTHDSTEMAKTTDGEGTKNTRHDFDLIGKKDGTSFFFKTGAPPLQMPGHTGFLTFATLYPS